MKSNRTTFSESKVLASTQNSMDHGSKLLSQSIANLLDVARDELAMNIVFISRPMLYYAVINQTSCGLDNPDIQELSTPLHLSFCQRILDGRLPAVIPDIAALSVTHDVPNTSLKSGAYMSVPIRLQSGKLYGLLCCIRSIAWPELGAVHQRRLEISARQIARLLKEAGEI